jgi:hypothetical protein
MAVARRLRRIVRRLQAQGLGTREIAAELNRRAIPTPQAARWHPTSVHRLIRRLDEIKWAADDDTA